MRALYHDVLHRSDSQISQAEVNGWVNAMNTGMRREDVVHAFEILQFDLLDFAEIYVAGEALRPQIFDERIGGQVLVVRQPLPYSLRNPRCRTARNNDEQIAGRLPQPVVRCYGKIHD